MVIIENHRGMVQMKAAVTSEIHPQVVSLPHDWGRLANQNYLTAIDVCDPTIGCPAMRAIPCRVRKAELSQAPKAVIG
jgi:anaerobic selenocysteine-containing dehydrogenase